MSDQQQQPPAQAGTSATDGSTTQSGTTNFDPSKFVSAESFNGTAAQIRRLTETITGLTSRKSVADELLELGIVEKDEEGKFRPRSAAQAAGTGKTTNPDDDPVARELKALKAQIKAKDDEVQAEKSKSAKAERNRAITAALNKAGAINPDRDYIHIAEQVVLTDSGYVVRSKGEFGEDKDILLDVFAGEWLKKSPELMKSSAPGGSGTAPRGSGSAGAAAAGGGKVIPYEQWTDMAFMMANNTKFVSGEYVRGPKAGQ